MKNLLTQANRNHLAVSVIVNDMSDLDVDGVLIANTARVGLRRSTSQLKICSGIICLTLYLSKHPEVATHCH